MVAIKPLSAHLLNDPIYKTANVVIIGSGSIVVCRQAATMQLPEPIVLEY